MPTYYPFTFSAGLIELQFCLVKQCAQLKPITHGTFFDRGTHGLSQARVEGSGG